MKKLLSIILVISVIGQTMVNVGIGVYYHLNKEYISKQLCINRNNPQVHCNGHCFLSKQLKKADQNEKQSSHFFKDNEDVISEQYQSFKLVYFPSYTTSNFIAFNTSLYFSGSHTSLLKPPAA